jgi:hypothetical protein
MFVHSNRSVWCQSGGERLRELSYALHENFIIRRIKADVLPQLPELRRQIVYLNKPGSRDYERADELAWQVRLSFRLIQAICLHFVCMLGGNA